MPKPLVIPPLLFLTLAYFIAPEQRMVFLDLTERSMGTERHNNTNVVKKLNNLVLY